MVKKEYYKNKGFNLFMLYIQKNQEKNVRVKVVRPDTERELCF